MMNKKTKVRLHGAIAGGVLLFLSGFLYGGSTPCSSTNLWAEMLEPEEIAIGTTSSSVPEPICGEYFDADSWFSFEAPAGGDVAIQLYAGSIADAAFALYQGPCDNLEEIGCATDYLCGQEPMPAYYFEDLDPGETYFLRIWNEEGPVGGTLDIIIANPSGNPYITTGSANEISFEGSSNCIELTPVLTGQVGCAWYPVAVDFSEVFEHQFNVYLGDIQGQNGADGMTIIYTTENIPTCGQPGGGIGYLGIPNSLGIEFDTYINGPPHDDLPQDHTAISINGDMFNHISGPVGLGAISDGEFHEVVVSWDPATQSFQVSFDGTIVHSINFDLINNAFGGETSINWGVSASTGGSVNQHVLCFENLELEDLSDVFTEENLTLCEGESVFLEGALQTEAGTYVDVYPAANGCDSIHTTILDFIPLAPPTEIEVELCPGDIHIYEGEIYNQTGIYEVTLTGENGCDSIILLDVQVEEFDAGIVSSGPLTCGRDSVRLELDVYVGEALSYFWSTGSNDSVETVSLADSYWLDVTFGNNCSWSDVYEVEEEPDQLEVRDTLSLCVGGQTRWMGFEIDGPGDYDTIITSGGYCDTLFGLHVVETDYIPRNDTLNLCPDDSIEWEGMVIDSAGSYEIIIPSSGSCDTLAQLEVVALDYILRNDTLGLCPGDSIVWEGITIDSAGPYEVIIPSMASCDTFAQLEVLALDYVPQRDTIGLCPDESVLWQGMTIDSVGNYDVVIPAAVGCDTFLQLRVRSLPRPVLRDTSALCPGESLSWRGLQIDSAGTYFEQIPASVGCDTFAFLSVNALPYETKSDTLWRCVGDTIIAYGEEWDTAGVYPLQLPATIGCDTLLDLYVIDLALPEVVDSITLCPAQDTLWRGERIVEAGEYRRRITASTGCDTIATLIVDTVPYPFVEQTVERCPGVVLEIDGLELDTAGEYETFLPATAGCDTLLQITVIDVPLIEIRDTIGLCPGRSLEWQGQTIESPGQYDTLLSGAAGCDTAAFLVVQGLSRIRDTISLQKCAGDTIVVDGLEIDAAGTYSRVIPSTETCDTLRIIRVEDLPLTELEESIVICPDESYFFDGVPLLADTSYQFRLSGLADQCDTLLRLEIQRERPRVTEIRVEGNLCEGPVVLELAGLLPEDIARGQWSPGATNSDSLSVQTPGRYTWRGETPAGCEMFDEVHIPACAPCNIAIPNVFSPNGDGINDQFIFSTSCQMRSFEAKVFDRWGNLITESRQPQAIWDGGGYGPGVYVYQIRVDLVHPNETVPRIIHGSITLIR
jgi:gliding motility-associated-like protein